MFGKLHRKKFVSGREPLSDADFLLRLNPRRELHCFVAAAREALARVCDVPPTALYPNDTPASVVKLMTFDWDDLNAILELEQILGIAIEGDIPRFLGWRFFWRGEAGPQTIGEWCVRVAEHLHSRYGETHIA
jgi:hypothetical protein